MPTQPRGIPVLYFLFLIALMVGLQSQAQDFPVATATALQQAPQLDGDVRNDPIWQQIETIGELIQTRPNFGAPASEKTEIRIAYTEEVFYVSAVCYDAKPGGLVVSDARRDANLDNTDAFLFIVDTYKDGQNGFIFGTNSLGVQYDAQVDNEGQGNFNPNRQQAGTIGGFNLNWDASWEVYTEVGDYGWSAEFAIPVRTLRFQSGKDWGINIRRNIRKTNEVVYWAQIPVGFTINRLSLAGTLTGLDLRSPGNLKVIPYVLGRAEKDFTVADSKTDYSGDAGADLKFSVTPSLTLDLTYNTDFAQVEVDDQQVNLDRFNLFFPEKRPFFLENAGQFTVGSPGEVDLFFSRRIGIGEGGRIVPIIGGARLSGKLNKTNIGLLSMFTDDVAEEGIEKNNFSVARVNHEFGGRTAIGAVFINKENLQSDNSFNRTFAVDGKLGLGNKARFSGFYAKSQDPEKFDDSHSYKLQYDYQWNNWVMRAAYTEVGEGFNPEVGFLLRSAFRKPEALVLRHVRPRNPDAKILEYRPHVSYRGYWNFEGFQETGFLHIDNHFEYKSGLEFHTGINFTREGVVNAFEISDGVVVEPGTYDHAEAQIIFFTNRSNPLSISTRHVLGGSFGGSRYLNSATLRYRQGDKLNTEIGYQYNKFDLPQGTFSANVFRGAVAYSFTPNMYLQGLIQNNTVTDLWALNVRFGWLQRANSGLFFVINANWQDRNPFNNSFIIKYSRMIDLVR